MAITSEAIGMPVPDDMDDGMGDDGNSAETNGPPGPRRIIVPNDMYAQFMEEHTSCGFAAAAAGAGNVTLMARSQLNDWTALDTMLREYGFQHDCTDAWLTLGLVPSKTVKELTTLIQRRLELARTMLTLAEAGSWADADVLQAEEAGARLNKAAETVQRELASNGSRGGSGQRRKQACQELGARGLQFLRAARNAGSIIGTQCSNHLGLTEDQAQGALPAAEASDMWLRLCSSAAGGAWTSRAG